MQEIEFTPAKSRRQRFSGPVDPPTTIRIAGSTRVI
jgi:hypothetical protein